MNFKLWLEGIKEYEPYQKRVQASDRSFAFNKWFVDADQNGRIYLSFNSNTLQTEDENKIIKTLSRELEENGYQIADLKKGYAKPTGKNNFVRIGKLLELFKSKKLKEIEQYLKNNEISKIKYEQEIRWNNSYYDDLKSDFENLSFRVSGTLEVVISKNVHDLAAMSTGRGWTSCMNLASGLHKEDVYCEIKNGGFVAYLIKVDDKNIEHPLSRIHIRRFDKKQKLSSMPQSIAIQEETVYGKEVPGFSEIVKNWIMSKQGQIPAGYYKRTGGKYSDTFSNRNHFIPPTDSKRIINWINKWFEMGIEDRKKYAEYFMQAIVGLLQSKENYPNDFVKNLKEFIFNPKSMIGLQSASVFLSKFAIKFPKLINKNDFIAAFKASGFNYGESGVAQLLLNKFPQFVDDDLLKIAPPSIQDKIINTQPELVGALQKMGEDEVMNNLTIDNPAFATNKEQSIYKILGNVTDLLRKLQSFHPIPERIIVKLVEFAQNRHKLKLEDKEANKAEKIRSDILQHIIFTLSITNSDTPTVQKFYKSLLPIWEEVGGIGVLGYAIKGLKENGKQFLPFIEQKRKEVAAMQVDPMYQKRWEQCLESYDYVIESLKNGHTNKYDMTHGVNFDAYNKYN